MTLMSEQLIFQLTDDGSFTFFSPAFGEAFHSHFGAKQEAEGKFVLPTHLRTRAQQPSLTLLDICYGLGYNTAAALEAIWQVNPACQVQWIGLELNPDVPRAAIAQGFLQLWSAPLQPILLALAEQGQHYGPTLQAKLWFDDARQTIQTLVKQGFRADAIFLDPFSPPHCPQLWTVEFLREVSRCLSPTSRLATYSCAASVRTALQLAGLFLGSTPPVGRRSPGTVASFITTDLPPLSLQELEHLQTRAAIPYRDPRLCDSAATIVQRRLIEQQTSGLEPTTAWKRRWFT
jgi:tRNA U34 5-methylaminomethyl-2-thiouridine-forming methyltransferase MnmC